MNTIKLIFENLDEETSDMIAAMLSTANVEGFEYEGHHFYAFFTEANFDEGLIAEILKNFDAPYTIEKIASQNWNERWEAGFEPVIVNDEVGVRAHFHPPFRHLKYDIEITPKMSFGTGHHATTRLMLQYMCETDFTDKSVFDFGCGTGVLSIFASLKRARQVTGTDNDPWSITNAIENCERNQCNHIEITDRDIALLHTPFDVILANINLNILIQYKHELKNLLKPDGKLFLSGLMTSDRANIIAQYVALDFECVSQKQEKEWIALAFKLKN